MVLLSFNESLATKCVSLNRKSLMARPTLTDLNLVNLNYYPFLITLDEYNGSWNVGDDLSMKIRVSGKEE